MRGLVGLWFIGGLDLRSEMIPVSPGTYRLNISLSGSSTVDYLVVFPAGDVLLVKGGGVVSFSGKVAVTFVWVVVLPSLSSSLPRPSPSS
jgi:hypothetical protein